MIDEFYYCGIIEEIFELSYLGDQDKVIILQCHWFKPIDGVKVNHIYGLVDIKHISKLQTDEPSVLAEQAHQVYYTRYQQNRGRNNGD